MAWWLCVEYRNGLHLLGADFVYSMHFSLSTDLSIPMTEYLLYYLTKQCYPEASMYSTGRGGPPYVRKAISAGIRGLDKFIYLFIV